MQNRAGPTCEIRSWSTSPFGNSFLEFFRGNFFFSEPPNIFQAALSGPVRMVWSAPVTVGWGAEHSQPLLAGPTCEISSRRNLAGWTVSQVGPAGPGPEPHTKMVNNMGEIVQYFFSQSVFMTNGLILQYLSTRNLSTRKGAKASAKACRVLSASPRRTV